MAFKKQKAGKLFSALFILLVAGGTLFFIFRDKDGPELALTPDSGPISLNPLSLALKDENSGLQNLTIKVSQGETQIPVLAKTYPGKPRQGTETFQIPKLKEGEFQVEVSARDGSFLGGNLTKVQYNFFYDSTPPVISLETRAHNIRPGGSGLVVYSLSENAVRTGIKVGERFFPGYLQPSGKYYALFAFPYNLKRKEFQPVVIAEDQAGNTSENGFYFHVVQKRFRRDRINVSDGFLTAKMPQFKRDFPNITDNLDMFLKVNQDMRKDNRQRLYGYGEGTASQPLWEGNFLRQPGSTMATFGDIRSYYYKGKKVDTQTHLGVDLASTAQAPIRSANSGKVVFAGFFGIYGNCVIVDHGLGLQTLYGHLTRIDVKEGQTITKGDIVGTSGTTGMAGGDHLHFGVLVSGLPVNPVEWWDSHWLQDNISRKISPAN
ncbi:MAG: M23 family metallopeptidase [Deltaproteobacteria bacterium]|nr:M23 family metallopeptidase [Deltaproteobacteria bacterium]